MAGLVTMTEINCGIVSLEDLMRLNALLDAKEAAEHREMERQNKAARTR